MKNRFYYRRKANAARLSAIAFFFGFFAAAAFAYGTFIDPASRPFSLLPGSLAAACLVASVIQAREASHFKHRARMNAEIP